MPAYNEENFIVGSVGRVLSVLDGTDFELFIVDDSSTDGTPELAAKLASEDERVKYIRYDNGPSRRENLADSFREAGGDVVGYIDADLSAELNGADIVVGSRLMPGLMAERKRWRRLFSQTANAVVRAYFNSSIMDHQCGLKVFKRDVIFRLVDEAGYDSTMVRGWSWDTEVLVRAQRHGYRIREVPVEWSETKKTSVRVGRDWRMMPYILKLKHRI